MKTILRLLGLGLAALSLVFLTNCAQSSDIANNQMVPIGLVFIPSTNPLAH